jgi:hypothetical protein
MSGTKVKYITKGISFSGQDDLLEAVKAAAKKEHRSFSNYVCGVLRDYLGGSGMKLKDAPNPPAPGVVKPDAPGKPNLENAYEKNRARLAGKKPVSGSKSPSKKSATPKPPVPSENETV